VGAAGYCVADVDGPGLGGSHTATRPSGLFDNLLPGRRGAAPAGGGAVVVPLAERLAGLPSEERAGLLLRLVISQVSAVSGHAVDAIASHQPFRDMGLDSLGTIQLRNRVNAQAGLPLATTGVYKHPPPTALARHREACLAGRRRGGAEPVAARLRELEAALAAVPAGDQGHPQIARMLEAMLANWRQAGAAGPQPPTDSDLDTASDEEIFEIIDGVLGPSE